MNKVQLFLISILLCGGVSAMYADELDTIISRSVAESPTGRQISNTLKIADFSQLDTYLALIPDLSVSAGYSLAESTNYMYGSLSFSKSFSDVDGIVQGIRMSKVTHEISKITAAISLRSYIDQILLLYTSMAMTRKEIELQKIDIENTRLLLEMMNVKLANGKEIAINVEKTSNELVMADHELESQAASLESSLRDFEKLTGLKPDTFVMGSTDLPENKESQLDLEIRKQKLSITNADISLGKKKREHFLPTLSLSLSMGYDIDDNDLSAGATISASFSFLEYFARANSIKQKELALDNDRISLSNLIMDKKNTLKLMKQRIEILSKKMKLLESDVRIEVELQKLYKYQYATDQIDYLEYKRRLKNLLNAELILLRAKKEMYIYRKRLQYGIVKS